MSLSLTGTKTALATGLTASFLGVGGTGTLTYSVRSGGAGGSINSSSGLYTAPAVEPSDPSKSFDTVQVKDSLNAVATAQILVGSPLILFCEIIQRELGLAPGRVYLWDQKVFQPIDSDLYIAVSVARCKPFGNTSSPAIVDGVPDWSQVRQVASMMATLDIDAISRSTQALTRKEEILLALASIYSEAQQESNSFSIGRISSQFINLSNIDGAAIPYRFKISVNMQYAVIKQKAVDYFDDFRDVQVNTNS